MKSTVAVASPAPENLMPGQLGDEIALLMDFAADCIAHGTIEVTHEFATTVRKLHTLVARC